MTGKRNGRLSIKTEQQDLSSSKGRQFANIIQQSMVKVETENRSGDLFITQMAYVIVALVYLKEIRCVVYLFFVL